MISVIELQAEVEDILDMTMSMYTDYCRRARDLNVPKFSYGHGYNIVKMVYATKSKGQQLPDQEIEE